MWRLAVSHAVPAGSWEVVVVFNFINEGTVVRTVHASLSFVTDPERMVSFRPLYYSSYPLLFLSHIRFIRPSILPSFPYTLLLLLLFLVDTV
jgi:hypothetical protein